MAARGTGPQTLDPEGSPMDTMHDLQTIFWHAVHEVDPVRLIENRVSRSGTTLSIDAAGPVLTEELSRYRRILVLGMGKASASMAMAMERVLESLPIEGTVITKHGHGLDLKKIRTIEAGHPVPDENSVRGAGILSRLADNAGQDTLIINLVSGGGSSLFCLPADDISLGEKQETTRALLASGAAIDEVNCVRKHLSRVKGGRFAARAFPARLISLILSDVVGDRLDTIASGITAPDPTTYREALSILGQYHIEHRVPPRVLHLLQSGMQGLLPETPKAFDPAFERTSNIIVGSNALACRAAAACAEALGYDARILSTTLTGEAAEVASSLAGIAWDMHERRPDTFRPMLLIAGGETTVTLKGSGLGGRNQEMALAFACSLDETHPSFTDVTFLSAGTDGTDGHTDAAGAFVTPELMRRMPDLREKAREHLAENDSYRFFRDLGLLFTTGPTRTNVCDIQLLAIL